MPFVQGCVPTMARALVVNAAQLASYSQSKQALLDSGTTRTHVHARARALLDRAVLDARRLFQRRHLVSFLRQHDQRPGYHGSIYARGHREDQVRPRLSVSISISVSISVRVTVSVRVSISVRVSVRPGGRSPSRTCNACVSCLCLRIQNMRMIDGKPEYKNGLVSGGRVT